MHLKSVPFARASAVSALLACVACMSTTQQSQSVQRIDDLLARIEHVQVDAVLSKEAAHATLDQLSELCAPNFSGDASQAYVHLLESIDNSDKQAKALRASVEPMQESADEVFRQWTLDLEHFGNTRMRQRSQSRLDETHARYQAIFSAAQSALISYEAFNADTRDHALFLGHDLNASAVASLAGDVLALKDEAIELDGRLDACARAARAYVETGALHGQVANEDPEPALPENKAERTAPKGPAGTKHKGSTLKPRATSAPAVEPTPQPAPAPEAVPPAPAPSNGGGPGSHSS